jgi:hypothetical protein
MGAVDGLVVGVGEAEMNRLVCVGMDSIDGVALRLIDVWIASGRCVSLCVAVGVGLTVVVVDVRGQKVYVWMVDWCFGCCCCLGEVLCLVLCVNEGVNELFVVAFLVQVQVGCGVWMTCRVGVIVWVPMGV